jgi:hypothetical protein
MKKRAVLCAVLIAVVLCAYATFTLFDSKTSVATAAKKAYSATVYIAGHGGHFAKAEVTIDPNNADDPLKVASLDRVVIGTSKTHPTHDARIDSENSSILFWSTYIADPDGKMHIGKSDLKTGNVIKDVALTPDAKAPGKKPPLYCASGQSKNFFMPVFMGTEGYVDVVDKKSLENKHRVFVSDLGYKTGTYKFVHGTNSPDMKKFLIVLNQAAEGKGNGKVDFILVDMAALEQGKLKELAKTTLSGEPEKTLTFRQTFSPDGKYIYQSAGDRLWVIDAATLKLVDEKMIPEGGQLHDTFPTADNKYAVLTVRSLAPACGSDGMPMTGEKQKDITDGTLMLYDGDAKKLVGKTSSICQACHKGMGLGDKVAILCGIDGTWKK